MRSMSKIRQLKIAKAAFGLCLVSAFTAQVQARDTAPSAWSPAIRAQDLAPLMLTAKPMPQGWEKLTSHARLAPMAVLLGTGSSCVLLAYDANGNRTTQAVTTISSTGAVWGATAFGCFIWH